jgi:hypothetical protein
MDARSDLTDKLSKAGYIHGENVTVEIYSDGTALNIHIDSRMPRHCDLWLKSLPCVLRDDKCRQCVDANEQYWRHMNRIETPLITFMTNVIGAVRPRRRSGNPNNGYHFTLDLEKQ